MKVDHISFSSWGGAGSVAATLTAAQRELGIDAVFHSLTDSDLRRKPLANPELTARAVIDKYLVTNREVPTLTSLYRRKTSKFDTSNLRAGAIPHFHWIEGLLTHERLAKLVESAGFGVWTIHDMAPLTGFCHHALECTGFQSDCERCPQAKRAFHSRVALELSEKRFSLGKMRDQLKITAPSNWLAQKVRESVVFSDFDIRVIPNPINPIFFATNSREKARAALGVQPDDFVAAIVASDLNDPNKRVREVAEAFLSALESTGATGTILLVGNGERNFPLKGQCFSFMGGKSPAEMSNFLAGADLIVSGAIAESAGMTIAEAAAAGVPSLVLGEGAVSEMFVPDLTGYAVSDFREMKAKLEGLMRDRYLLKGVSIASREFARARFHPEVITGKYVALYEAFDSDARGSHD